MEKQTQTLENLSKLRSTNLQCLRFLAAMLVIICHAYPLSNGEESVDILGKITHGNINLGGFAVAIFFLVSGFYAVKSASKSKTFTSFFKKKILRMLPPLMLVTLICTFLLGPLLTSVPIYDYFTDTQTYRYLLNGFFIPQHNLPGVFDTNIYGKVVNGSLWTMPVELLCITGCYLFTKRGFHHKRKYLILLPFMVIAFIITNVIFGNASFIMRVMMPCMMFFIGMGCYVLGDYFLFDFRLFVCFLVAFIVGMYLGLSYYVCLLFLPYLVWYISYGLPQKGKYLQILGNASYEMYLWGFVIQQVIVFLYGGVMSPEANFIITMPIVIILGCITHLFSNIFFIRR